jgi:hypothetical protein
MEMQYQQFQEEPLMPMRMEAPKMMESEPAMNEPIDLCEEAEDDMADVEDTVMETHQQETIVQEEEQHHEVIVLDDTIEADDDDDAIMMDIFEPAAEVEEDVVQEFVPAVEPVISEAQAHIEVVFEDKKKVRAARVTPKKCKSSPKKKTSKKKKSPKKKAAKKTPKKKSPKKKAAKKTPKKKSPKKKAAKKTPKRSPKKK